jgi:hypothetical protein
VSATVSDVKRAPMNGLEILEVKAFEVDALPRQLSHGMSDVLRRALLATPHWE